LKRQQIEQFRAESPNGRHCTIIRYRIFHQSDEIRSDRMIGDPSIRVVFETADGREVKQNADSSFKVRGVGIVWRV